MANTQEKILRVAMEYCSRRSIRLASDTKFGSGVHGTVFGCLREVEGVKTALKIHEQERPYCRERDVYLRLEGLGIRQIEGHHVPQLIDFDDDLWAIEMSVVVRPFVLDFGGAYLDHPPDYGDDIIEQWERDKEEQFEENWPQAQAVLIEIASLIGMRHMLALPCCPLRRRGRGITIVLAETCSLAKRDWSLAFFDFEDSVSSTDVGF